ncbi:hypothetical protein J3Q64DRAFT_1699663 [Phycomyces blakesleeanus]|uniref:Uncharacterized protein n=2 Tax=Phycomyces blakesleeanus TaxID=4837 RepID=A0A162X3H6_PHYB8|nr:hypothetical protein PHYBLDRAFT_169483 [Phycomyces blakesleeanus NRRL 1555(-)]OAD72345.1 hypothetical protein PHYBLDRAFT_169483 [Phycomyces blakesleeanus NRRL 1555(-)]|eukprot:XP_018290385.1 hypothetical protein PHYBLDRAFT_169483 [Phycomyces blakesleeanus NRRL 1555(-)]
MCKAQDRDYIEQINGLKTHIFDMRSSIDTSILRSRSIYEFIEEIKKLCQTIREDMILMRSTISELETTLEIYEQSTADVDKATKSTVNSLLAQLEMSKVNYNEMCKHYERTIQDIQKNTESKKQELREYRNSKADEIDALKEEVSKYKTQAVTAETLLTELKERCKRLEEAQHLIPTTQNTGSTAKNSRSLLSTASYSRQVVFSFAKIRRCRLEIRYWKSWILMTSQKERNSREKKL